MTLPLLTASRLKTARACSRLDRYKYQLGYRAVGEDAEALTLGKMVHSGLEAWWHTFDLTEAIKAVRAYDADPFAKARAEAMLAGYHLHWFSSAREYEVLAVEAEFRAPLVNPATGAESRTFMLGGKLDGIVKERATGRVLIIEHKTSGEDITPGSLYRRRLRMDGQVSLYFRGATALGHEADGCLYDVLAKSRLKPLSTVPLLDENGENIVKDESGCRVRTKNGKRWRQSGDIEQGFTLQVRQELPTEFRDRLVDEISAAPDAAYARFEVSRDSADLAEADSDAWAMAGLLRDNARTNRHPRNVDACDRYGRCCEFIGICDGSESLDSDRYQRVENVHPELTMTVTSQEETIPCQSLP